MYHLLKKILFLLGPESAHELVGGLGSSIAQIPFSGNLLRLRYNYDHPRLHSQVAGIHFANPVGMAAGFDKTGELYPFLSRMGFGFVESGTFTYHAQPGNPRPRLFRYPTESALINRMGFNNPGSEAVARLLQGQTQNIPRGINLGKSKITALAEAVDDYLGSLQRLGHFGNYIVVNVSSPNTPGLRQLQDRDSLYAILSAMQTRLNQADTRPRPLFVKLAPDLTDLQLDEIVDLALELKLGGIILTNTTLDHSAIAAHIDEIGGLSGKPVRERSTSMIRRAYKHAAGKLPIIGVGGIGSGADALDKIRAGASLIQIYTGYIYAGPTLPYKINQYLSNYLDRENKNLSDIIGSDAS